MTTPSSAGERTVLLWVFLGCLLLSSYAFVRWMPVTFFGDDLANHWDYLRAAFPTSLAEALTQTPSDKYRPVFHWILARQFEFFGDSVRAYLFFNLLLHALNATLVFCIALRLTERNLLLAISAAALITSSRFALYQVTQVTGLVEGLAYFFFLLSLFSMTRVATLRGRWRDLSLPLAFLMALLAVATHERYIVYFLWFSFVLFFCPNLLGRVQGRWFLAAASAAFLPGYFFLKKLFFGATDLVGTGGQALAFNFERARDHAAQAVFSISGYNYGPDWLIGTPGSAFGDLLLICAVLIAMTWIAAVVAAGFDSTRQVRSRGAAGLDVTLQWAVALTALAAVMLSPMMTTIRLEQRWLLQPFALMVLAFCAALSAGLAHRRVLLTAIGGLFMLLQAASNLLFLNRSDSVSFVYAGRFANEIDTIARSSGLPRSIAIIGAAEHCDWTLRRGDFFLHRYGTSVKVTCYQDSQALQAANLPDSTLVLRQTKLAGGLVDVSQEWADARRRAKETVVVDLVAAFPLGSVNDDRRVDSPSGRGSMVAAWDSPLGARSSLTVVAGFAHVFSDLQVMSPSRVRASAVMVYPSGMGTNAIVRARLSGQPDVVVKVPLQPRQHSGEWIETPIELRLDRAGRYTIEFEVQTGAGVDSSGHWVAFMDARIVEADSTSLRQ